ncbi:isoamyl acetate-hydrolyzing esterase 1 homolog isoform X1 [Gigantopelta aegis]|uniref:isoamyl acetate-hydrolyzing esterase 1 homolog isoform X1 n=1 Tax=Gigantopelta aegis TaxID=1735272 RepID=UPI001B88CDEE|nr:isoamyl acetate-hydrolyzing esterase 1 homolog isoform X1 [Gigantopelta aegis]XP_041371485.1 isoamyl acetate-hydrolyzing esterase 1 homolog isoform X1 [Gigantopelta aegis]
MTDENTVVFWPKIVLFGDSLTQHCFGSEGKWGALLADHLQRKCDVINRGFSGYNVRWCKYLLPQLISEEDADVIAAVTIFLGTNDSNDATLNSKQHVPLEEYQEGLNEMVEYLQSAGLERHQIILITPPPCDVKAWEKECTAKGRPMAKSNKTAGEYAKACVEAANECGTKCVDLYTAMMKNEGWEEYLHDGLHLSSKGSEFLFGLLRPLIDQLTSNLKTRFPLWDQIDEKNPEASLCLDTI